MEGSGPDRPVGQVDALAVPRFAGVRTFARLPTLDQVGRADVAVVEEAGRSLGRGDDVLGPGADLRERGDDDLEAPLRLLVRVDGRLALAGHDRRRSRDMDVRPNAHRPRVANGGDER